MKRIWYCRERAREREDKLSSLVTLDVIVIHNHVKQIDLSTAPYCGVYNTGTAGMTSHMRKSHTDHLWPNIAAVMPVAFIPHIPPPSKSGTVTVFCLPPLSELNWTVGSSLLRSFKGLLVNSIHLAAILVSILGWNFSQTKPGIFLGENLHW